MRFLLFLRNVLLALGGLAPLNSLVMELATHACAAEFFDPIPTWRHVLLVALMPLGLGVLWYAKKVENDRWREIGSFAHGAALGSVLLYVLALGQMNVMGLMMLPFAALFFFTVLLPLLVIALLGPLAALV
ncbi:MAG: hypothetical protein JNG86_05720, partial [Verrucomicrobiaceae bacterium]|nr:hypothetical protein [Verrucomicrobiaceae bacterium]